MVSAPSSHPILDAAVFAAISLLGRPIILWASDTLQQRFFPEHFVRRQAMRLLDAMLCRHEGLPGDELILMRVLVIALALDRAGLYGREPGSQWLSWIEGTHPPPCDALSIESVENGTALIEGYATGLVLTGRTQITGYLVLGGRTGGFGKAELRLLRQTCEQLALALENQWLGRTVIDEQLSTSRADEDRVVQERVNAVVSHQLKTPLLLSQSMLADARHALSDRSRVAKRLDKIATALARFERNVIQNLDRHRISLGRYELEVVPTPLVPLIGRCLDEVRYVLGKRGASALLEVPSDALVLADAARLEIIFDNLIGNALKVIPAGGRLAIRSERVDDRLRIDVSDDGPGIPPARLEKLFSVQAPNPEDPTSTGIGLAICRDYMVGMGGSIELHAN
ncbi:MAG TPA: HAMP domain-containing sensor histidine kinase, partial [Stenomitos sp.]